MRSALFATLATLLMAAPATADSPEDNTLQLSGNGRKTAFMAGRLAAQDGAMPVLRICYESSPATQAPPKAISVHIEDEYELLGLGECSFFSGRRVEVAVWDGSGPATARVTLLRRD